MERVESHIGAQTLHMANLSAVMGCYQMLLWERMATHVYTLLDDTISMAKQQLNPERHIVNSTSRSMASATVLLLPSWLRHLTLPNDIKASVQGFHFERQGLV